MVIKGLKKNTLLVFFIIILNSCFDPYSDVLIHNTTWDSLEFISTFYINDPSLVEVIDSVGNIHARINPYQKFIFIEIRVECIGPEDMPDYLEIRKPHDTLIYRGKETIYQLFDFTNPGKKKRKKCDGEWIYYIR